MTSEYTVTYVMHYNVTLVLDMMLLSFVFSHKEGREYFLNKIEVMTFNIKIIFIKFPQNPKSSTIVDFERCTNNRSSMQIINNDVYVIDLENE